MLSVTNLPKTTIVSTGKRGITIMDWKGFAWGVLFGTAGIRILSSRDAKTVYTYTTAAVLRGKDEVVKQATVLRENCSDIYEDAKEINRRRAEEDAVKVVTDEKPAQA